MGAGSRRRRSARRRAERAAAQAAEESYVGWAMRAWGCFAAFFGYLILVSEVLDEPGAGRTLAHALGAGIVGLGLYSAFRSMRSGRVMESTSAREASEDLARWRTAGGTVLPWPDGATLPLTVAARPELVNARARTSPLPWLVGAVACLGLSWRMSDDLGYPFPLTVAGVVGFVAGLIGLSYVTNRRGRIVVDEQRLRVRTAIRTRTLERAALQDAVDITLHIVLPRGPDQYVTSVHVVGRDGRRAFSLGRHVYDEPGVATVLGVLQLPLHLVPGHHDPATVEAFVPGSTSLLVRRPFLTGIGLAAALTVALAVGIVAWVAYYG